MNTPKTLEDYYRYWDEFVDEWNSNKPLTDLGCQYEIKWTIPQKINGSDNPYVETLQYLPEPWWGNNGRDTLSAVVINLNPGQGGVSQLYTTLSDITYSKYVHQMVDNFIHNKEYKVYIDNRYVKSTTEWLLRQRALPIFKAFPTIKNNRVNNVLGIDLIPWHSVKSANVTKYIETNYSAIYNYSIKFALKASENIKFEMLRNVVIARVASHTIEEILIKNGIEFKKLDKLNYGVVYEIYENSQRYYLISVTSFQNNMPSCSKIQGIIIKLYQIRSSMNTPELNSIIAPNECQYVGDFASCGLAPVMINDKYGYVNQDYKVVIPFKYNDAFGFQSNGLAKVRVFADEETVFCGIINAKGEEIVPLKYSAICNFENGVAKAYIFENDKEKIFYFDEKGNIINK